jgi:5'-nucleotidase
MKNSDMIILLTNDDGIDAPGLKALQGGVDGLGEIWVVAPDREQSATAHSLTLDRPLRLNKIEKRVFSVNGTPTDAVMLAVHGILKRKPHLLLSGINRGPNLGDDVTYSGTVAAAFEGTLLGIPSIAISLADWNATNFNPAAKFVRRLARFVLKNGLPEETFLNVNIPPGSKEFKRYEITKMGKRIYRDVIIEKTDPRGKKYFWIAGEASSKKNKDTDFYAIARKVISITPLHLDLTNYKTIEEMRKWKI